MNKTKPGVLENWRAWAVQSQTVWAFIHQDVLPDPDTLTPNDIVELLSSEDHGEDSDGSVLRFLLHIWNYEKHSFDVGEIVSWSRRDLQMFADWLTASKPCPVLIPDKHDLPYSQNESEMHDPQFRAVHLLRNDHGSYSSLE